jgi:dephospho-CoA kinase
MKPRDGIKKTPLLGLTGSIGSGKSEAATILSRLGAAIVDADVISRQITSSPGPTMDAIRATFGDEFVSADGSLNRPAMAKLVFSNAEARRELESILHPRIRKQFVAEIEQKQGQCPLIVGVIPLLYESKYPYQLDKVMVISAPAELSLQRIMKRDGSDREFALKKLNSQLPIEQKEKLADIVVKNDGSKDDLAKKLKKIFQKLIEESSVGG